MARVAICQAVLLLLCLKSTRASANQLAADDQAHKSQIYGDAYGNVESDSLNDVIEEYNDVYIDDAGHGVRLLYGGQGAGTEGSAGGSADEETEIYVEECQNEDEGDSQQDAACDIEIRGADIDRKGRIPFGIDGLYTMIGCFRGFPVYSREGKTRLERRILWFSHVFEDWDVIVGDFTVDQINRPPLMYGASVPTAYRPELLAADAWKVMNVYHPAHADLAYSPATVSVECVGQQERQDDAADIAALEQRVAALEALRAVDV
eukprot:jgi/Ulvmu1/3860/UM018_0079.1